MKGGLRPGRCLRPALAAVRKSRSRRSLHPGRTPAAARATFPARAKGQAIHRTVAFTDGAAPKLSGVRRVLVPVMARARLISLGVLIAGVLALAGPAAHSQASIAAVLHLKFRTIATGAFDPTTNRQYVGYTKLNGQFVLLNDRTGKRITLKAGCGPGVLGGPFVAFDCGSSLKLYAIRTRKWRRIRCGAICEQYAYSASVAGVGTRWIALEVPPHQDCSDDVHSSCGPTSYSFYNVATGKRAFPATDAGAVIDLNSPSLTRHVCAPVQVPADEPAFPPPLTFLGSFVVNVSPPGIDLEQCGTSTRRSLAVTPYAGVLAANLTAAGFCQDGTLAGFFLPSLRPFRTATPGCGVMLAARHIYTSGPGTQLRAAVFPSAP